MADKKVKITLKSKLLFFTTLICFVGLPALLIAISIWNFLEFRDEKLSGAQKNRLQKISSQIQKVADPEIFWCQFLHESFLNHKTKNSSNKEIKEWLVETRKSFRNKLDFLIWDQNGKIIYKTFPTNFSSKQWKEVFLRLLTKFPYKWEFEHLDSKKRGSIEITREVLGPQTVDKQIAKNIDPEEYSLTWADSSLKRPPTWSYFLKNRGYLILIPKELLKNDVGVKSLLKAQNTTRETLGIYYPQRTTKQIWLVDNSKQKAVNFNNILECESKFLNSSTTSQQHIAYAFINPEVRLFSIISRNYSPGKRLLISLLAAVLFSILMSPFIKYIIKTIWNSQPGSVSIRWKLAFLFFFANGLPLLILGFISQEYYTYKKASLIKKMHGRGVEILTSFDESLKSQLARFEEKIISFFEIWKNEMNGKSLNPSNLAKVTTLAEEVGADKFYVLASESNLIGTFKGIEKIKKAQKLDSNVKDLNELALIHAVGQKIMADINGTSKPTKGGVDTIEIVAESFMQRSLNEIVHSFIEAMSGINPWGFGEQASLAHMRFYKTGLSKKVDFMSLILWKPEEIQSNFIKSKIVSANRNPINLKVIARNISSTQTIPENFPIKGELKSFCKRIGNRINEEIEYITLNNKQYAVIGFTGKHLSSYQLIGLFPLDEINRMVQRQKNDLILFGLFSVFIAFTLAQLLTASFVYPLQDLTEGALAIEERDFSFRIAETGKDELGEIAQIINEVMVGLEELKVAGVVQESLFPEEKFSCGSFSIYGKSIAMAELGGDYLDYFEISPPNFGVLMGDVAGHGVGAAVIMAMAKAGILSSTDLLSFPSKLLTKLHELIYKSKTKKQKKIMTFQYLFADSETGKVMYSNAGGCSPIFVSHKDQTAQEVSLPGAALGAFKKTKFQEKEINFSPGDAMIFYTDGIIEAHNSQGEEIGYEQFSKLVLESWDENPENYYNNIYKAYLKHIGEAEAEDDLTIIVCLFSPNQENKN